MENPIKVDDLEVPLFSETPIQRWLHPLIYDHCKDWLRFVMPFLVNMGKFPWVFKKGQQQQQQQQEQQQQQQLVGLKQMTKY